MHKGMSHAAYQQSTVSYTEDELNQTQKRLRVRTRDDGSADLSEFDFGVFYYSGTASNNPLGNFFIELDIAFHVPTLSINLD